MQKSVPSDAKILAVDDNQEALFALEELLQQEGYQVITAANGRQALDQAKEHLPDLILLDVEMPGGPDGISVARQLKSDGETKFSVVVLLTAKNGYEDIAYGLDQGADNYIAKPYNKSELLSRVKAALRQRDVYKENRDQEARIEVLTRDDRQKTKFENIVGASPAMRELFSLIEKVADSDAAVLVTGESGTGKELVASALHYRSSRKDRMFVAQNCSAFNDNLLESELFGHVRGAFTGAVRDKQGLFEIADGGTFLLDELGEMSAALQVKLLRVLQEGVFLPVGSTKPKKVDVRVVGATNRDLQKMVEQGTFREDLYYRLNVVTLKLPALRERREDIPLLANHFLKAHADKKQVQPKRLTADAIKVLTTYNWPGNIRQLQNEIERIIIMSGKEQICGVELLSPHIVSNEGSSSSNSAAGKLKEAEGRVEREMILEALNRLDWNKSKAAKELGISRSSLIAKVKSYGLEK